MPCSAKPQAAKFLKILDYFLCGMLVFANNQMHVIAKNGARIASIFELLNCLLKSLSNAPK